MPRAALINQGNSSGGKGSAMDSDRPGLLATYRQALQARHYARRTVQTYERWIQRFLRYHRMKHRREMGGREINAFLTHLAVDEHVSPSTQNQGIAPAGR